jgi:ankyrin repeat protein
MHEINKAIKKGDDIHVVKLHLELFYKPEEGTLSINELLSTAVKHNRFKVAKLLIDYGAEIKDEFENAVLDTDYNWCNFFIEIGADPNMHSRYFYKPIFQFAKKNRPDLIELFHRFSVNIDLCDNENNTPLLIAIKYNAKDAAQCLVDKGANINKYNNYRSTPLIEAVKSGSVELVYLLLLQNARKDIFDINRKTALSYVQENDIEMRKLLLSIKFE